MRLVFISIIILMLQLNSFKATQLKNSRVKVAYDEKENTVKEYFSKKGLSYDGFNLFIRAFKQEEKLEVWIKDKNKDAYSLLVVYDFCSSSGTLGPKRKEGDLQIPEGFYQLNHFNPQSNFYLSLGVSYPNASDKILSDHQHPGGAIYIHGNCVTIGCIPITDNKIKELYVLAVEARNNGQLTIPIHIFPAHLNNAGLKNLKVEHGSEHEKFWDNLKPIYEDFEETKKLKKITVGKSGLYVLK